MWEQLYLLYETTSSGMQILYYGMELLVPQHKICIQEIVVPFCLATVTFALQNY